MLNEELQAICPTPVPERRKKVAILGFVDHYKLAPFNDPTFEIWGLNELYAQGVPRWDRWFEIHDRAIFENVQADGRNVEAQHIPKLRAMTCPIYMSRHWDDIPNSVPYPVEEIAQAFPNPCPDARPYLNNTITDMILLATHEGFEEIGIYGVDMAHDTEYASQRPSCEWAVGIAQGRGIKVYIPHESDLLKTNFLYGFEQSASSAFDMKLAARRNDLNRKLAEFDNQIAQLSEIRAQYRGALQDTEHIYRNWKGEKL